MGVVADPDQALSSISGVDEAVGTGPQDGLVVGARAPVELIEVVTVFLVG